MPHDLIIILTTCASKEEAGNIINALLKARLVACANVISGVESTFWWNGKINKAKEFLVIMKTVRKNFNTIVKAITRIHSYEVAEIVAIPIVAGSDRYLKWLKDEASG